MTTKVAAAQMRSEPRDVTANLTKAAALAEQATSEGAQLVLFPELFNSGYFIGPELFELWEPEDGRSVTWMREAAARHRMVVAGSIAERREQRLFNTLFIAEPDGRLVRYSKRQPTKAENAAFDAGDDPSVAETSLGRVGCAICADLNWGESLLKPLAGSVDLLLVPQANSPPKALGRFVSAREQKRGEPFVGRLVRAVGAPLVMAGQVGPAQRLGRFFGSYLYGGTWITDAQGTALASVRFDEEGVVVADVKLGNTGGDNAVKVFRDPGLGREIIESLQLSIPNLRPQRT